MANAYRAVLIVLLIALIGGCERSPVNHVALRAVVGSEPVVLLSATWCGYCRKLRSDLNAWNVPFRELDVETSEAGGERIPAGERAINPGAAGERAGSTRLLAP